MLSISGIRPSCRPGRAGPGTLYVTEESMVVFWLGLGLAVFAGLGLMTLGCEKL